MNKNIFSKSNSVKLGKSRKDDILNSTTSAINTEILNANKQSGGVYSNTSAFNSEIFQNKQYSATSTFDTENLKANIQNGGVYSDTSAFNSEKSKNKQYSATSTINTETQNYQQGGLYSATSSQTFEYNKYSKSNNFPFIKQNLSGGGDINVGDVKSISSINESELRKIFMNEQNNSINSDNNIKHPQVPNNISDLLQQINGISNHQKGGKDTSDIEFDNTEFDNTEFDTENSMYGGKRAPSQGLKDHLKFITLIKNKAGINHRVAMSLTGYYYKKINSSDSFEDKVKKAEELFKKDVDSGNIKSIVAKLPQGKKSAERTRPSISKRKQIKKYNLSDSDSEDGLSFVTTSTD